MATAREPTQPILEMEQIHKRFGPVSALKGVDLRLAPGEILGLLGGNGAGKTTLMNVLFGLYKADEGSVRVRGREIEIRSPRDAIEHGIGMVHQHFLQVPQFSVTENIVMGSESIGRLKYDLSSARSQIRSLSDRFGLALEPDAQLEELPMGIRQRVEILKALYRGVDVLILDEPTTLLTPQEVDLLFDALREMVTAGMSIIFITHKLREVLAVSDRITVLRGGQSVLDLPRSEASERILVDAMVGEALDPEESLLFAQKGLARGATVEAGDALVSVQDLQVVDDDGSQRLDGCTFMLNRGEILGVAGVAGNGQRELAESLLGMRSFVSGTAHIDGSDLSLANTDQLLAAGVAYVPEDRWGDGFLPTATVAHNLILGRQRRPPFSRGRFLDWGRIFGRAQELIADYQIVTEGPGAEAANLSGGNIQRVLLARAFDGDPKLLIVHNPTQGLDIPSIEFVYSRLLEKRREGMATLLISENLDELFLLCDRIAVLFSGRIMQILERDQFDAYRVGRLMSGVSDDG